MTQPNHESTPIELMIQVLDQNGFRGMAHVIEILVNEAMKIERAEVLGAQPYERTNERRGYANAQYQGNTSKPKTLATRVGKIQLQVPQTRGVEFYATGVLPDGKRTVLGVSVSLSEAEVHWRKFFASLVERGLHGVEFITSDDHAGLKAARKAVFPGVPWQRCQFHLQQNARQYVPKIEMRSEVVGDIRGVFNATDRDDADRLLKKTVEKYSKSAPKLADWMERAIPEGLTVFARPESQRKRLRTSNMVERLNEEIRRRTRVATLFPNEASLLRLVTALLAETDDQWQTGKTYLQLNSL